MGETVMVLPPDQAADKNIERRYLHPPRTWLHLSSHFACWLNIESTRWTNAS